MKESLGEVPVFVSYTAQTNHFVWLWLCIFAFFVTDDFEKLKSKLATLPYSEIMNIWNEERSNKEECETKAIPIVQLREMLIPELVSLIQQHRLQQLTDGTLFTKYAAKGQRIKDKFWYCRLSPNFKVFHYGDWDEKSAPPSE